jgi:ketosteroid isomerase-like protein
MKNEWAVGLAIAMMTAGVALPRSAPASAPAPHAMSAAECEVWLRERSFAKTVEAHDAGAFAAHLVEDTVFGAASPGPVRGRAAVVADWKEVIEGTKFALRWHPQYVSIGADPDIAISSGPAWTENFDPAARQRFTTSRFNSVWKRDARGEWHVLFDGGTPPKPATAEEVARLVASLPATCPRRSS